MDLDRDLGCSPAAISEISTPEPLYRPSTYIHPQGGGRDHRQSARTTSKPHNAKCYFTLEPPKTPAYFTLSSRGFRVRQLLNMGTSASHKTTCANHTRPTHILRTGHTQQQSPSGATAALSRSRYGRKAGWSFDTSVNIAMICGTAESSAFSSSIAVLGRLLSRNPV